MVLKSYESKINFDRITCDNILWLDTETSIPSSFWLCPEILNFCTKITTYEFVTTRRGILKNNQNDHRRRCQCCHHHLFWKHHFFHNKHMKSLLISMITAHLSRKPSTFMSSSIHSFQSLPILPPTSPSHLCHLHLSTGRHPIIHTPTLQMPKPPQSVSLHHVCHTLYTQKTTDPTALSILQITFRMPEAWMNFIRKYWSPIRGLQWHVEFCENIQL